MEIITVSSADIRKLSPNLNSIQVIYEELNPEISGIDANTRENTIYWSNGNIKQNLLVLMHKIFFSKTHSILNDLAKKFFCSSLRD